VTPPVDESDLQLDTVLHKPIVLAVPRGHALASRSRVPLSAVAGEPLILFPRGVGPGFFDAIASACRVAGFDLRVKHEVDNLHSAYGLVAAGLGVSFVPAGLQGAPPKGVVLKSLAPHLPRVDCELALAYRRERVCDLVGIFVDVVNDIRRGGRTNKRTSTRTV
jgi:DNA-binding transcriptional LysR family regulator